MRYAPGWHRSIWEVANFTGVEVAMIAMAAAAAVSAIGQIEAGRNAKKASEYNAQVAEARGRQVKQAAAFNEQRQRDQADKVVSTQQAAFGRSGVQMVGSPLLVVSDTAAEAELDALAIRYSGSVEEANAKRQAAADRLQGKIAQQSSYYGAATSLLGGASRAAGGFSAGGGGAAAVDRGGSAYPGSKF